MAEKNNHNITLESMSDDNIVSIYLPMHVCLYVSM